MRSARGRVIYYAETYRNGRDISNLCHLLYSNRRIYTCVYSTYNYIADIVPSGAFDPPTQADINQDKASQPDKQVDLNLHVACTNA